MKKIIKNERTVNVLLVSLLAIMVCGLILLFVFRNNIKDYLLPLFVLALLIIGYGILYVAKESLSSPTVYDLRSERYKLLSLILPAAIFAPLVINIQKYINPQPSYFAIVILIAIFFLIVILLTKSLSIGSKGISYAYKWEIKWEDIAGYDLNKATGVLNIQKKDGTSKEVTNINSKFYSGIEENIKTYIKNKKEKLQN